MTSKLIEICKKHPPNKVKWVCTSPSCNLLSFLCDICISDHNLHHLTEFEEIHPNLKDKNEFRTMIMNQIEESRKALEKIMDSAHELFFTNDETALDPILIQLDEIKKNIDDHFKVLKNRIKMNYEEKMKKVTKEMRKQYDDLRLAVDFCLKYSNKPLSAEQLRNIYVLDLNYQVRYKKEKLENIIQSKAQTKFDLEITKEFKDRFMSAFDSALGDLIYDNVPYKPMVESITYSTYGREKKKNNGFNENFFEVQPDSNSRKFLHYFEENTKNFYYIDLIKSKTKNFEKIVLNIDFKILENHRSILTNDGEIYLVGGQDKNICEKNEDFYKTIYKLDLNEKSLVPVGKMTTLRHSFGIVSIKSKLYFVGGASYKEGALIKCETFDTKTLKTSLINFLNVKSMNHSTTSFKENYIFKFGGMRYNLTNRKELSLDLFERYDISADIWEKIKLKDMNFSTPIITYLSCCHVLNENNIFVFGGKNENHENQKSAYLISFFNFDNKSFWDKMEENSFTIMEINSKSLPTPVFFANGSHPVIVGKTLYVMGNINESERKIFCFEKQWKQYN